MARRRACSLAAALALGLASGGPGATREAHAFAPPKSRVAVMPLQTEGDLSPAASSELADRLVRGLAGGDLELVPPSRVASQSGIDRCDAPRCHALIANATQVRYLVRPAIRVGDRGYELRLDVVDGPSGEVVATSTQSCDPCGSDGAARMLEEQAAALRPEIDALVFGPAVFTFISEPPGATVELDDRVIGTTPLDAELPPGDHMVEADLAGHRGIRRDVKAVKGMPRTVSFALKPVASPLESRPRRDWKKAARPAGWTMFAVGIASLAAGITFLAIDKRPYEAQCSGTNVDAFGHCRQRYDTLAHGAAFTTIGAVLAAGGLTLALVARKRRDERGRRARLGIRPTGLVLEGRF